MGSFTSRPGQLSKPDMLQILTGHKNEPSTAEDFIQLQKNVLDELYQYLSELKTHIEGP